MRRVEVSREDIRRALEDTLCNRLREAGVDLETIRKLLRHASTSMTLKYAYCVCSGES
jgi:site-specific recombinase XerD